MGTTEVFCDFRFEAAHRLTNVPLGHKCGRLHGHSYKVTVYVMGEVGADSGWVMDYADIKREWVAIDQLVDHRYLNEIPGLENSTSELLAKWIFDRIHKRLAGLTRVMVRETCTAGSVYYGESPDPIADVSR